MFCSTDSGTLNEELSNVQIKLLNSNIEKTRV